MPATDREIALEVLKLPPVEWAAHAELPPAHPGDTYQDDLSRDLDAIAFRAVRCARYFSARERGLSHREAVRKSNQAVARVRKALGYTYPNDDLSF